MLVNMQTHLPQIFRKYFFYTGLSIQKISQTKGFCPSFEQKPSHCLACRWSNSRKLPGSLTGFLPCMCGCSPSQLEQQ